MVTLFIACPAGLIPDGRQLARCIGLSAADEDTFATVPMVRALASDRISVVLGHEGTGVMARLGLTWVE